MMPPPAMPRMRRVFYERTAMRKMIVYQMSAESHNVALRWQASGEKAGRAGALPRFFSQTNNA